MTRDEYQYHGTTTKIKQQRYYSNYSKLIHKDNQALSNNYNSIIRKHSQDLLG